ncbi:MAG: glycosyltransferase [Coriobacteriia bacterium]|nr:glycosyltransferase [Coriobacteriia bacterium]
MTENDPQRIAVLITAFNEADRIKETVVAAALVPGVVGVIVANDGSEDATAEIATSAGALVVSNKHNLGKGAAMELAATSLEELKPFGSLDGVLLLDGDLGLSASAAKALLEPLKANTADMVVGILPSPSGKAGFGLALSLARDGIREFGGGFEAKAPLSGQRAMTLECLCLVRPFANGYAMEVDMTVRALQQQLRVAEVPVDMQHRATGRNLKGFIHRGRQFLQINRLLRSYYKQ